MEILLGLLYVATVAIVNVGALYCFAHLIEGIYNDNEQYLQSNGSIVGFRYCRFYMGVLN